jgi:IS605 OrfB family transposase
MSTIHRSYEVLIEETVTSENREQRKHGTKKLLNHNTKTTEALRLTNDLFQDAICYYTMMLAGMVKNATWTDDLLESANWMKEKLDAEQWKVRKMQLVGQKINPLWNLICSSGTTSNVIGRDRLNRNWYQHAIFSGAKSADEFVAKAFCFQGEERLLGNSRKKRRRKNPPDDELLLRTFVGFVLRDAMQFKAGKLALKDMASFAGVWSGYLCTPAGSNNPKGTGAYDRLHLALRTQIDNSDLGRKWRKLHDDLARLGKDEKVLRKETEQKIKQARADLLDDENLQSAIIEAVKKAATDREAINENLRGTEFKIVVQAALASPKRNLQETEEEIQKRIRNEFDRRFLAKQETALETYRKAFQEAKLADRIKPHLASLRSEIASAVSSDTRIKRLQEDGKKDQGPFTQTLYRLLWAVDKAEVENMAASDVLAYVIDTEPVRVTSDTLPYQEQMNEPLFPFFSNSLAKDAANLMQPKDQVVWDAFDTAAFKRAAEEFFKYAIRTQDRQKKIDGLCNDLKDFLTAGRYSLNQPKKRKAKKSANVSADTERPKPRYAIFGMKDDDDRKQQIEKILDKLKTDRGSGESGYGLRGSTIGGWAYLRPELLKTFKQGKESGADESKIEEQLIGKVEEIRSKTGGGFGSADFFYALCETENHILWLDTWPNKKEWHAPDFVLHYARYSSKLEDLREIADAPATEAGQWTPKPINFTWPGEEHSGKKEPSYRPFDFKCDICEKPSIQLFAKNEAADGLRIIETNSKKYPDFPLTLSFRRLKRDRIVLPDGTSLESFFSPPKLVNGSVVPPPLAGPRIRPADIEEKRLESFLEDLKQSSSEAAKLLAAIRAELLNLGSELAKIKSQADQATNNKDKNEAKKAAYEKQNQIAERLAEELTRLITGNVAFYKAEDLNTNEQKRIQESPTGLEHQFQNRKCLVKMLKGILGSASRNYRENVALLAPKRANGAFHMMFAVEVNSSDLVNFRVPSVPGEKPFRLTKQGETKVAAYLRWPVDLLSEAAAIKKGKVKATQQNETTDTTDDDDDSKGKASLPKADELWMASTEFKRNGIHVLFVDLGVRFAGAWSRSWIREATGKRPETAQLISPPADHPEYKNDVWCQFYEESTFRLQGEDAHVWHRPKGGQWTYQRELYGSRGRLASPEEIKIVFDSESEDKGLAEQLFPSTNRLKLPEEGTDAHRFIPAIADHLMTRLDRRLSRIGFLFTLRWHLEGQKERNPATGRFEKERIQKDDQPGHYRAVVEALASAKLRPEGDDAEEIGWNTELRESLATEETWQSIKPWLVKPRRKILRNEHDGKFAKAVYEDSRWQWTKLADAVHQQLGLLLGELGDSSGKSLLAQVADFAWPLRDKVWHWQSHRIDSAGKQLPSKLLRVAKKNEIKGKIIGQGGLNMTRIELLQRLRRDCHSLARHEARFALGRIRGEVGVEPPVFERGEAGEPCQDLLDKINELRDQRVDQAASLILAEALGLELQNPSNVSIDGLQKWQLKSDRDVHGRYQRRKLNPKKASELGLPVDNSFVPQCSIIVVEDLSRYLTSLDRSRFENRRLMDWSHRAIIKKLKDMAKVFGIEIAAVDARYSSRYCSKSHVPGIRVAEVKRDFEKEQPWRRWKDEKAKGKPTERANQITKLIGEFEKHPKSKYDGTLLIEMEGGPLFLAFNGEAAVNADINASKNIGLRAIAHPDLWHFFPVIRTESDEGGKLRIINRRGTLAALDEDNPERLASPLIEPKEKTSENVEADSDDEENETSQRPYLFVAGQPNGSVLELAETEDTFSAKNYPAAKSSWRVAKGKYFWSLVISKCRAQIDSINQKRIAEKEP